MGIMFRHYPFINGMNGEDAVNPSGALLMGLGNSTVQPESSVADKNFMSFYLKSTATSGTSRGMYLRLYLPSNAGGEALRAFTTVSSNTPADTVNGAHISLNFGSSAGNVTGLGTAVRATLHLGNRAMTGTLAAVQAELYADGASSTVTSAAASFLRFSLDGNATGVANAEDYAALFSLSGVTIASGNIVAASTTEANYSHSIRIKINGTAYYLMLASAEG